MRALSKLKLFVLCSCHLPPTVWQRQMMCSNHVGRKMYDGSIMSIIEIKFVYIVQLSRTSYSVVETDDV